MNKDQVFSLQNEYVLPVYSPSKLFVRGQGAYLWDADGRKFLDFTTGISVCNLGHCHPMVTEAIQRQAATLVHTSNLFVNELQPQLAAKIAQHSFNGRVFFANSGAEANEGMIKFARAYGHESGRYEVITLEGSFHGRTLATLAATGQAKYRAGFEPQMPGFKSVPAGDLAALKAAIGPQTVAVMMEPVQGEGGVRPLAHDYLAGARALCDEHDLLLLFDEVQCGMGRTGKYFAHQHHGIVPDAMSLAKALGNGYPIGAFEVQRKHEAVLGKGQHASTFGGTPLACAAALGVFQALETQDVLTNCQEMGEHLRGELVQLATSCPLIKEVRGLGLMIGIELTIPAADVVAKVAEQDVLILSAGEKVLRLLPPLTVNQQELSMAVAAITAALGELS